MWLPYMTRYACTAAYSDGNEYDMYAEDNGDYVRWEDLPEFAAAVRAAALEQAAKLCDQMEADERVGQAIRALIGPKP